MTESSVIEKVKKMLARADTSRGATEHEAETAMRMAMELLARHNLGLDDVTITEKEADPQVICDEWFDGNVRVYADAWGLSIGGTSAIVTFTSHFIYRNTGYYASGRTKWKGVTHIFIGRPDNINAAKRLTEYLLREVLEMSREWATRQYNTNKTKLAADFRDACAQRLRQRARELKSQAEAGTLSTTLPALRNMALVLQSENERYIQANMRIEKMTGGRRSQRDLAAHMAGSAAANRIDLTRGREKIGAR
jgi:hypothetical protein